MNWKRVSVDRECTVHALPIVNLLIGSAENWSLFRHFYRERQRDTHSETDRERVREREFEISSVHRHISVGKMYKILNSIFHNFIFLRKSIKFHGSTSEGGCIDNSTKHLFDFSVKL